MKILCSFAVATTILLYSCTSCTRTDDVICTNGSLQFLGIGFLSTDFDSAITVRYKQDNAFDSVIDTIPTYYTGYPNDTCEISMADSTFANQHNIPGAHNIVTDPIPAYGCTPGYDYQLILPTIGKTYSITRITQSGEVNHVFTYTASIVAHGPFTCYNTVVSCNINGTTYGYTDTLAPSYFYIQK